MVSHRHRDSRVPSMQKSSSAPLRRRLAYLLPLHHRHRWRTHHPRSPPTLLVPHHWPWRHLTWGVVGPTRPRGAWEGVGRAVGRVGTAHREVFSSMHGPFGEPTLLHCPCLTPPGALPVLHNTLVHRRGLPRGESSSLDHPSGLMSCDVHQHVTPTASYFCEAIAQRVGMGLRPGKLRKKALGKGYEDGERP